MVAPFEYTALIWGVLYGWIFWSDWPDSTGWIGIAIIVGSGLFVIWMERRESLRVGHKPTEKLLDTGA